MCVCVCVSFHEQGVVSHDVAAEPVVEVFDGGCCKMFGSILGVFATHVFVRELSVPEIACPCSACSTQVVMWFDARLCPLCVNAHRTGHSPHCHVFA